MGSRIFLLAGAALLTSCQLAYYGHLARGQYQLLAARRPISEVIEGQGTDPALKSRLAAAVYEAVLVLDATAGAVLSRAEVPDGRDLCWSPDGKAVAVATRVGRAIYVLDPADGRVVRRCGGGPEVESVAWSPWWPTSTSPARRCTSTTVPAW